MPYSSATVSQLCGSVVDIKPPVSFYYCNLRGKVWATYLTELSVRRVPVLVSYFNRGTHAGQANWCVFSAPLLYSKYLGGTRYEEGDTELLTKKDPFTSNGTKVHF